MAGSRPTRGSVVSGATRGGLRTLQIWLGLTDLAVIVWATFGAQVVRFGIERTPDVAATAEGVSIGYTTFSLGLALAWWLALRVHGVYAIHTLGHGTTEYRLLAVASLRVFAVVALLAYALQIQVARGYVLLALPAGMVGLFLARRTWRRWLAGVRVAGGLAQDVLVVGDESHSAALVDAFADVPSAGYRVVGVCASDGVGRVARVPVLGTEREAARVAIELGVDVVACASSHRLGTLGMRRLGWALEGSGIELVVSPGLTEVAGPRVITRPVAGLPLLHVEAPQFSGARLVLKSALDWTAALCLVVAFSPFMLAVAAVIKLQDGGPVFFRQQRVGLDGRAFELVKFRSMVTGAPELLPEVRGHHPQVRLDRADGVTHEGGRGPDTAVVDRGVLFKLEEDPRVTRFGRFIRRYSIDELPQLFDVLAGTMSLVGPRPPLPSEVSQYEPDVHRRLLVKPGMTGLWQVNGRSDLTWEESVRFDLYYVENWSVTLDLIILWRTFSAVMRGEGAY